MIAFKIDTAHSMHNNCIIYIFYRFQELKLNGSRLPVILKFNGISITALEHLMGSTLLYSHQQIVDHTITTIKIHLALFSWPLLMHHTGSYTWTLVVMVVFLMEAYLKTVVFTMNLSRNNSTYLNHLAYLVLHMFHHMLLWQMMHLQ